MNLKEAGQIIEMREQIQEDIRTFMLAFPEGYDDGQVRATSDYMTDNLCDIVVANFNKYGKEFDWDKDDFWNNLDQGQYYNK